MVVSPVCIIFERLQDFMTKPPVPNHVFTSIVVVGSVTRQPKKWPEDLGAQWIIFYTESRSLLIKFDQILWRFFWYIQLDSLNLLMRYNRPTKQKNTHRIIIDLDHVFKERYDFQNGPFLVVAFAKCLLSLPVIEGSPFFFVEHGFYTWRGRNSRSKMVVF